MASHHPQTLAQAVDFLCSLLSPVELEWIRSTPEEDLILLHFGLSTTLRNTLDLWHNNEALRRDAGRVHPDDVSLGIVEALWKKLQTSLA